MKLKSTLLSALMVSSTLLGVEPKEPMDSIKATRTWDWNTLSKNGFYESSNAKNAPLPGEIWFWGFNTSRNDRLYNGQIAIQNSPTQPNMFVRSTGADGSGVWGRVLNSIPQPTSDWNDIWENGFYEGHNVLNAPEPNVHFWGINLGHSSNYGHEKEGEDYKYGGQIAIKGTHGDKPVMYIRSKGMNGSGVWGKVLTDQGIDSDIEMKGRLTINKPTTTTDWNNIWKSGFYESSNAVNAPEPGNQWFWGINMGHSNNADGIKYGGQIAFKNRWGGGNPIMYIRAIGREGTGNWGRVLTNKDIAIDANGNFGIGTDKTTGFKLSVNGNMRARQVIINQDAWADYVFEDDYDLLPLSEVKDSIEENGHLPRMKSAEEIAASGGFEVGETSVKLLEKIEELTLYTIEQDEAIKGLETKNRTLEEQLQALTEKVNLLTDLVAEIKEEK